MGRWRWLLAGFAVGAGVAFAVSLLRKRRLVEVTGYQPPVPATGPQAVLDPGVPDEGPARAGRSPNGPPPAG